MKSRIIAIIIALGYFILILLTREPFFIAKMSAGLFIVLSLILYSEEWGSYTGFVGFFQPRITKTSPGWLVAVIGWILLLVPIVILIIQTGKSLLAD
ncbi:MAG: hypothetical protein H8D46_02445 [FCB group bacterium]|nr:hypothetical protein [FCB group bacterium]